MADNLTLIQRWISKGGDINALLSAIGGSHARRWGENLRAWRHHLVAGHAKEIENTLRKRPRLVEKLESDDWSHDPALDPPPPPLPRNPVIFAAATLKAFLPVAQKADSQGRPKDIVRRLLHGRSVMTSNGLLTHLVGIPGYFPPEVVRRLLRLRYRDRAAWEALRQAADRFPQAALDCLTAREKESLALMRSGRCLPPRWPGGPVPKRALRRLLKIVAAELEAHYGLTRTRAPEKRRNTKRYTCDAIAAAWRTVTRRRWTPEAIARFIS